MRDARLTVLAAAGVLELVGRGASTANERATSTGAGPAATTSVATSDAASGGAAVEVADGRTTFTDRITGIDGH